MIQLLSTHSWEIVAIILGSLIYALIKSSIDTLNRVIYNQQDLLIDIIEQKEKINRAP